MRIVMHMSGSIKLKVAIVGASGYAGAELIRIIHAHPHFELGVIAADVGNDRDPRSADVRRVQPPSQPGFEDRQLHSFANEQ